MSKITVNKPAERPVATKPPKCNPNAKALGPEG